MPGQPSSTFTGGAGMGGGRAGDQPSLQANADVQLAARSYSLQASTAMGLPARSFSIKAAVEYGGSSRKYSLKQSKATTPQRAGSSSKSSSGEMHPRVADPEGNFIFTLEIDGIEVAQFKECSGLKSSTAIFELEEGGMNHRVHKLAGQSRWENITLRYGVTSDSTLLSWRNEVLQDEFSLRRNGSVVMKTLQMQEVRRYNFVQAWPVAWEGPSFDANAADLAVEMVEIAHHGISVT
ncbi:MAG: phage tail protein [Pseudomonadota bacterium]|nr:phage tail protein [Pseudomonadota bacterium]